jgi:hypothetical protein
MKKIIVALLILVSVCAFASPPKYTRITRNGGSIGYNNTYIKEEKGNTKIICSNPGYEPAPFYATSTNPECKEIVDAVIKEIASGKLKGSFEKNGVKVKWKSDDVKMTNSRITIK